MTASFRPRRWQTLGGWFLLVLLIALLGRWQARSARPDRCGLDGNRITPVYQVDLMAGGRVVRSFCSVACARAWPEAVEGGYWRVRDEITGEPLDAAAACYVESGVVTVPSRQERIHIFKHWADALSHAAEHGGRRIGNPLAGGPSRDGRPREEPPPPESPPDTASQEETP